MVISGRKPKSGPEADLLNSALDSGQIYNNKKNIVIFREPNLPTGYPDVVAVHTDKLATDFNQTRLALSTLHIRFLHFIYQMRSGYLHEFSQSSLYPIGKVQSLVDDLSQAGMVCFRGKKVFPVAMRRIFTATRIVAIEAKMNDWSKAIRQAIANRWFSSHSYILLPEKTNMAKILDEAQSFGIGVMVYNGKKTKTLCRPKPQKLPTSYGSWLLNEWAIRKIHQGMAT